MLELKKIYCFFASENLSIKESNKRINCIYPNYHRSDTKSSEVYE